MTFIESIFYMAWRGIAIGLIISAPMGPVGMLCIQRTLDKGRRAGFYTGVGAALSDLFYSLLTGFGLSFIEEFLERNQNVIQLAGSAVLIAFGVYLFRKNPSAGLKKPVEEPVSVKKNILGGFLFTFSNPLILFLTIGLFARFNFLLPEFHAWQYFTGFAFIFVGAIIWWWFVTFSVDKVRSHFNIRSMWLVNRIIGVIIMLFAIVGIITATTALASGAGTQPEMGTETECWNVRRGLGPFSPGPGGRTANDTADTLTLLTPCGEAQSLEFRCKVNDHKSLHRDKNWGFLLSADDGRRLYIDIRPTETPFDGISSAPALEVETRLTGEESSRSRFTGEGGFVRMIRRGATGPDPTGTVNFYKIAVADGLLTLSGGLHTPERLAEVTLPEGFSPDSIGLYLTPGAAVSVDEARLTRERNRSIDSPWDDMELLGEYLAASRDMMEGYWQNMDRSLEESLLRLGGDYRYAMVRDGDGYDLLYLSGARINATGWRPGMVKASLRPSGIKGVWNVTWHDAMHRPMSHEIKAQTDASGSLTIQFPYQNSQLRLHRSEHQRRQAPLTPAEGSGR